MQHHLQAIVTVISLVNPAICGAMFSMAEAGRSPRELRADAAKVALAVLVILALAALGGIALLRLFGVSLDAFSVAGGGVLAWMGFAMLRGQPLAPPAAPEQGQPAPSQPEPSDPETRQPNQPVEPSQPAPPNVPPSLTPLILFAASPGTITGVITLSIAHTPSELPLTALLATVAATGVLWLSLLLFPRLAGVAPGAAAGQGFVRDTVTRFTGLIVIAMGLQFALTGIRSFMSASGP